MRVTTLPCKTSAADMFDFQQSTDSVRGHVQVGENRPDCFKSRLDNFWSHQDLIDNFCAEICGIGRQSEVVY